MDSQRILTAIEGARAEVREFARWIAVRPTWLRFGRQVTMWSWHQVVVLKLADDTVGLGVVPGYGSQPVLPVPDQSLAWDLALLQASARRDRATLRLAARPLLLEGMLWVRGRHSARHAANLAAVGFRAAKLKLSGDLRSDSQSIKTAAGFFSDLRVDANQAYDSAEEFLELAPVLRAGNIDWVEEPTNLPGAWSAIRAQGLRVIADESMNRWPEVIGSADGVNLKVARHKSMFDLLTQVERAENLGVRVFVGCSEDLATSMSLIGHLASGTTLRCEGWGAQRLGIEDLDRVMERRNLSEGTIQRWVSLDEIEPGAFLEAIVQDARFWVLRDSPALPLLRQFLRVSQGVANRALRIFRT